MTNSQNDQGFNAPSWVARRITSPPQLTVFGTLIIATIVAILVVASATYG